MRCIILIALLFVADAHAMGSKRSKPSSTQSWLSDARRDAVMEMAPKIGLDPQVVLKARVDFKLCEHDGVSDPFGPWVDGAINPCPQISSKVHAWCIPGTSFVRYMFAIIGRLTDAAKGIITACVRHEVLHELLEYYGITGHPKKVTIVRTDNGQQMTFYPHDICRTRWPAIVADVFTPKESESQDEWQDFPCGTEEVMRGNGEGI